MGSSQRVVGVIQARMGSTRLPGKVLADLGGRPVLEWVIEGARGALEEVVVATTTGAEDEAVIACARDCGAGAFAGSRRDVLERIVGAARGRSAATVVRLTADCPLLDPALVKEVLARHQACGADLTTNDAAFGGPPRGFDAEAIRMEALGRAHLAADGPSQREHVTLFLLQHPEHYRIEVVQAPPELRRPTYRLCVDTADDLRLCREVAARLGPARPDAAAIVALLDAEPGLAALSSSAQHEVQAGHV